MNCNLFVFVFSLAFWMTVAGALKQYEDLHPKFSENEVESWAPSKGLKSSFPYYWSGMDEEDRPIWVVEFGKWNVRKTIEEGPRSQELLEKYIDQMALNALNSMNFTADPDTTPQIISIVDLEGFNYRQLASPQSLSFILKKFAFFSQAISKYVSVAYMVNTNFVAETMINLLRPVLGEALSRFEVHGTNKAKWMPKLAQKLPKDQIPEWYGGKKGFAPLKIYG